MPPPIFKKTCSIVLVLALSVLYMPRLPADENQADPSTDTLDMVAGDIETVPFNNLTRLSVTNPNVADISDAENDKVSILAKKGGSTVLFLWDGMGTKRSIRIRVANEDLSELKDRVEKVLEEANISGVTVVENPDVGKVVLTGSLPKEDKNRVEDILQSYSDNILNFIQEQKNEELIQVDMQIVEISTSMEKDLGIQWGSSASSTTSGGTTPGITTETETLPSSNGNGKFGDFFKIGDFARTPLQATVNAFIQEGKARLISKPRLVAMSGKQASFLVGGEIPTLTTTTSGTGLQQTQNTTYTQYGVNVTLTPTIREGKIDILLNVDIRDIDNANSSNGNDAFITRSASTDLFMDNKQTIALAGLIKYSDNEQLNKLPFFADIPIVGMFFRNRSTPSPDTNTEMVIILTPMVLTDKKFSDNQIVMPTPAERDSYREFNGKYEHEPLTSNWPATVTPVSTDDQAAGPMAVTAYARMVQERISKAIIYPQAVTGYSYQGTVKLRLHILKNGTLDSEEVTESSGNEILDRDALQAAVSAAPFDAFSTGMDQEDLIFTVPIVYNKLMSGSQAAAENVIVSY